MSIYIAFGLGLFLGVGFGLLVMAIIQAAKPPKSDW